MKQITIIAIMHLNARKAKKATSSFDIIVSGGEIVDWQVCMNHAIDYIENSLSDKIDYEVAAQFMNCSVWEFERIFSFMAQVPLSEYIRRRRLTLAAHDIQVSKDKVIDVALRYGDAKVTNEMKIMAVAGPVLSSV